MSCSPNPGGTVAEGGCPHAPGGCRSPLLLSPLTRACCDGVQGAPSTDGFEAERAAERAVAPAPAPVPGSFAGQQNFGGGGGGSGGGRGGLGDPLLTARGAASGGGAAKKNNILLTVGAIGCVLGLFYAMGMGEMMSATVPVADTPGSCNQRECPLEADCSGGKWPHCKERSNRD